MQPELSIVVLTYNRRDVVTDTVARLLALGEPWPVVVVDNGSTDGSADLLEQQFPTIKVVRCARNHGAAGRNHGVAEVTTPFVAFCDDDTCWEAGSLATAAAIMARHETVAVLNARILVGEDGYEDPTCALMAASPLSSDGLPGHRLLGFMAGASVMRTSSFLACGGYEPHFFIGGEESLLALDIAARGWAMVYVPEVVTRHFPSHLRDAPRRRRLLARNAALVAVMRLPWADVAREVTASLRIAREDQVLPSVAMDILRSLPWALARRRQVGPAVVSMHRLLAAGP